MLRYLGVLAGHANACAEVVPGPATHAGEQLALPDAGQPPPKPAAPSRHSWARMLARVFAEDLGKRPDCQGRMRLLGVVTEPAAIERILRGRRTAGRAAPSGPARARVCAA